MAHEMLLNKTRAVRLVTGSSGLIGLCAHEHAVLVRNLAVARKAVAIDFQKWKLSIVTPDQDNSRIGQFGDHAIKPARVVYHAAINVTTVVSTISLNLDNAVKNVGDYGVNGRAAPNHAWAAPATVRRLNTVVKKPSGKSATVVVQVLI